MADKQKLLQSPAIEPVSRANILLSALSDQDEADFPSSPDMYVGAGPAKSRAGSGGPLVDGPATDGHPARAAGVTTGQIQAAGESAAPNAKPVHTEAVGLLAAGLAHDLNNMLGGIVATAELLQARKLLHGEDARDLDAIVEQASRASGLIRQILAFSRQEMLMPVQAQLDELLHKLMPLLKALSGPKLDFAWAAHPAGLVNIDPTALERTVVNLLLNARQAAGPRGKVRLSSGRIAASMRPEQARSFMPDANYIVISVDDDGPGVDPENVARIFEPYFTTRKDGQGLGLSTAYGLIKQSGGFLLYDRSPLGGARFSIYLPEAVAQTKSTVVRQTSGPKIVLLAEDDPMLRMSAARGLERLGYHVRQASDANEALRKLEEERPSLLISDIRLPGMDGVDLTRAARALYPDLLVLLVSGYAGEAARVAMPGLDVGFLAKPYTLKKLGERVREMV